MAAQTAAITSKPAMPDAGGALVGEHEAVLDGEGEGAGGRVVGDVAGGGLRRQPLPQVALGDAAALGQLGGGPRAVGERAPDAEPVAEVDEHAVVGGGPVQGDAHRERLEGRRVGRGGDAVDLLEGGGHGGSSRAVAPGWRRCATTVGERRTTPLSSRRGPSLGGDRTVTAGAVTIAA
ncbi:hypothetical protein [Nocardioides sp. TF02-7]|uniref:hypothetical protein n=1 Tax=Nocardioides sp. TF02-7 TaxID=2917724 RepID=UPI001F050C2C|nr:hypothetical protein [Nocardioides sp. TF02-7]UMG92505.1 hypothetical protein MF408_22190 [Nocardioides sp. TF02-7]